jgi:hypothetical protein
MWTRWPHKAIGLGSNHTTNCNLHVHMVLHHYQISIHSFNNPFLCLNHAFYPMQHKHTNCSWNSGIVTANCSICDTMTCWHCQSL